ncbi:MAG: response regulator [Deltaproteobacteria bacterium]|nr:response regulator [Deltaproteobacteria bacterium]
MGVILVVDDEIEACKVLDEFLSSEGYEVHTAYDGPSAIGKIKEFRPHLVLLDMIMPGMHGAEVLKEIKNIDPMVKVVMVTVVTDEEQACETFEFGAYDYITKPVDLSHLETILLATMVDSSS